MLASAWPMPFDITLRSQNTSLLSWTSLQILQNASRVLIRAWLLNPHSLSSTIFAVRSSRSSHLIAIVHGRREKAPLFMDSCVFIQEVIFLLLESTRTGQEFFYERMLSFFRSTAKLSTSMDVSPSVEASGSGRALSNCQFLVHLVRIGFL